MANKLRWFTHDHDARSDEFIQEAIDRFGHFGYAAYFMILEIIHQHGVGGVVKIPKSRLALNLRSRWPQVHLYLDFCRTSGKVEVNISGDQVQLQNKKFIERQRKMKSNAPAMLRQCSVNDPIEGEVEREGELEQQQTVGTDQPNRLKALIAASSDAVSLEKRRTAMHDYELLDMRMPFGQYKGVRIGDLEPAHCQWVLDNCLEKIGLRLQCALALRVRIKAEESAK